MPPTKNDNNVLEENNGNEILESSYELLTPIKTRSSRAKSMANCKVSPGTSYTRSGRKIKKIQYLEYETDDKLRHHANYKTDNATDKTPEKNSTLRELNTLKNDFNELCISSDASTPTGRKKSTRMISTPSKMDVTPRGKLISPNVTYSKSGRKIKKTLYSEHDTENFFKASGGKKRLLQNNGLPTNMNSTPKNKSNWMPGHTSSGRKIKKIQYLEDEPVARKTKQTPHKMDVDSPDSGKNSSSASKRNGNTSLDTSSEMFTPTKLRVKNRTPAKSSMATPRSAVATPKQNHSTNVTFSKSGRKIKKKEYEDNSDDESEEASDVEISKDILRPSALYEDDNVLGQQMFGFQTPKHQKAMLEKAIKSASKGDSLPNTPRLTRSNVTKNNCHKTPYNMRKRIKKGIAKEVTRQSIDSFLEDSGSDYVPSSSSSSSSSSSEESDDSASTDSDGEEIRGILPLEVTSDPKNVKLLKRNARVPINNFVFTAEDYFENKNLRSFTSNHTLSQLKTPRFNPTQLSEILKSVGSKHEEGIRELTMENEAMFPRWLFSMNEGYNILVYGVGSKKKLLYTFHRQFLSRCYVAVVNGYFPDLLIKDILDCIVYDVLKLRSPPIQPHDTADFIITKLKMRNSRLFLLVNSIDGGSLRCDKIQSVLAHLAADPNIHLVATLDHINSPLLWDQKKLSQFNFIWEDGTSFLPYVNETSYESSLMVQQAGGIALAGLKNIFKSLNTNSRKIFRLLLDYELESTSNRTQGMLFSELYRECRNSFLVSSDLALRTQLTEFIDHQLIKWKKDNEHVVIPLDVAILKQFHNYLQSED